MVQFSKTSGAGTLGKIGRYVGAIAPGREGLRAQLENPGALLNLPESRIITRGRNRNCMVVLREDVHDAKVVVKAFGRPSFLKDLLDRARGSKAFRTWRAASFLENKGVGTPAPVAFLERRHRGRLVESYYISEYQPDAVSFKDELIRLFREDPQCWKFMNLLQCVADAVRGMHEAGFIHYDLGNQNILLRRLGNGQWGDVQFIDLNRGRQRDALSVGERARDLSRIFLPSDLLRVFKQMYYRDHVVPEGFDRWERCFRNLYAVHTSTRFVRHPMREFRKKRSRRVTSDEYPLPRDMWIWDERSAQPIAAMKSRDRHRHYASSWLLKPVAAVLTGAPSVAGEYRRLMKECYSRKVSMCGTVGVAIDPEPESWEQRLQYLEGLGKIPAMIRLYHHEDPAARRFRVTAVRSLAATGRPVSVALVQDRGALCRPGDWQAFVNWAIGEIGDVAEWIEAGHAVNRAKWGVWSFAEHKRLMEAVADAVSRCRGIRLMGPSAIDFEYPFVMAALKNLPPSIHFAAMSHHLYVDRRGAPENRQAGFDALRKFALARAIARWAPACEDRLIVSEVNWPLQNTGVYSPVGSPYETPGPRLNDPSVSETEYAVYMIRYLAIAICSGMVQRVYWWRLVARGFGLVDDTAPDSLAARPAYMALKRFVEETGKTTYCPTALDRAESEGVHLLHFQKQSGEDLYLAWSSCGSRRFSLPPDCSTVYDIYGSPVNTTSSGIVLTGVPVYMTA